MFVNFNYDIFNNQIFKIPYKQRKIKDKKKTESLSSFINSTSPK